MHKTDEWDKKPCPHMRTLVSAWLDGRLTGIARWYTEWHVHHCPRCGESVPFFRGLHRRLEALARVPAGDLGADRWSKIEKAWEDMDNKGG
jgi:hypothetical protein